MEIRKKWFSEDIPKNAKPSSITIGEGDNGVVTITTDQFGEESNEFTLQVVEGDGISIDMHASLVNKDLVITLGTDGDSALDATKNTAELIADEVNALAGISAGFSGTGEGVISAAVAKDNFGGGQYGTISPEPVIVISNFNEDTSEYDYYTTLAPNGKYENNWRKFNLTMI